MKRVIFTSSVFYWVLVSILVLLLLWNLYLAVSQPKFFGFLPIIVLSILLVLIFKRHQFAKIGIKLWAIIFLIAGTGLQFLGQLIKDQSNDFAKVDLQHYLTTGTTILIGFVILNYTIKTVEIVETVEEAESTSESKDL